MSVEAMDADRARRRIALLPDQVRNQIAAGEVIERPASVVKELVENAIDAGARRIEIDLEEGGTRLVRVRDDGGGMSREDLELAFVAHATSKLHEAGDLEHIGSLGFRGEALASMGSVARCRILTRAAEDPIGWSIDDEGGRIGAARESGGARGTIVEVRDLFFNMPARRRFLKRASTELARCLDVIQRLALAHAGVGFVATHDGSRLFDVEDAMDLRARIRRTFGAELAASLMSVDASHDGVALAGYVAPPRLSRADTSRQMWFLNGRPLRDKVLARALKESFRGFLLDGRQPVAFLSLAMDPARVDVNVHPAKAEVRFRDEHALFGLIVRALRETLRGGDLATPGSRLLERAQARELEVIESRATPSIAHLFQAPAAPSVDRERDMVLESPRSSYSDAARTPAASASNARENAISQPRADERAPSLQIARTYIVRELASSDGGGFEIIDQHALHERVTFEGLLADLRAGRLEVQRFLVPEIVECSRAEVALVSSRADALQRIGVDLAPFGDAALAVHGLPARLARPDAAAIVREVIAVLDGARDPKLEEVLEEVLHRAACRSSVMAGDPLTRDEIDALVERGTRLESDQTCVHGRPTRVRFTLADLERAFQRR
jgi:DNA mismatch repair protein MutL